MSSIPDLDDINQSVIYIPFSPSTNDNETEEHSKPVSHSPFKERDLPDGLELRMKVYRKAWSKCLDRAQTIVSNLQAPVADAVVQDVRTAHSDVLPGLPYVEVPVISVTAQAAGPSLFNDILNRLDPPEEDNDDQDSLFSHSPEPEAFVTHLYPMECTSVMLTMKALISGFMTKSSNGTDGTAKRKSTVSLASYDIKLLEAWYEAIRVAHDGDPEALPRLVVMMYDFEQFDPAVVQDMFFICSLHIRRLPFVFILCLSSPPSPSYLHAAYPRSTLALLRVRDFTVPSGDDVLEELLMKMFFDVDFEPDILLGPTALSFLVEHFSRNSPYVDSVITILQLAHMKHFQEPLTVFTHDTLLGTAGRDLAVDKLVQPESFAFLDSIMTRLHSPGIMPSVDHATQWLNQDLPALLDSVDTARREHKARAKQMRIAFQLMRTVRNFMLRQGYRSAASGRTVPEMMIASMKGKLGRDGIHLGTMVKKLTALQLTALLDELHAFFRKMPSHQDEEDVRSRIETSMAALADDSSHSFRQLAEELGEWFIEYLLRCWASLEETKLWDIWYTGSTPFPSELINPSIRASIFSGLLNPFDFVHSDPSSDRDHDQAGPELWELPDTSILFRRYLDSGKMINVYDWFESFAVALEDQRRQTKSRMRKGSRSPEKGKGKGKQTDPLDGGSEQDGGDEDEEDKWELEVQARFMRALHELDYLGFIKHTGRKADHVMRTVFDVAD